MKGFIKIDRSSFRGELWKERRRFSRFEAWLDIQQRVFISDTDGLKKGEVMLRKRETARNWGWPSSTVYDFIKWLVAKGMLHRTERPSVYTITARPTTDQNPTTQTADNQDSYEDVPTTIRQESGLPTLYNKRRIEKKRAREDESVALANGKEARFEAFRRWADANIPSLATAIDISLYEMMLGQAYGHANKMADTLKAMEKDNVSGTPRALMKEYERRCPR